MKQKSLRALAKELGVSASYLSQVKNGKRPPSEKVLSKLNESESILGTSNPLGGIKSAFGGFDSHALPPRLACPVTFMLSAEHLPVSCLKRGVDSLHIMRLGGWESLEMVERYTRSVSFQDSLKFYRALLCKVYKAKTY
ncbi:helix-turn-helix domain-containing protein [Chloroflexota bacterium]